MDCGLASGRNHRTRHWRTLREQHRRHTPDQHHWKCHDHTGFVHSQRVPRDLRGAISTGCNTCVSGDRLQGVQTRRGIRTRFPEPPQGSSVISSVLGLDCCHCSRRFQLAHNSGDGSCFYGLIGRIIWRLNQWQF